MTQEEKAKRYDEAIERARALNNGEVVNIKIGTTTCEYIFPELKESEDERIKKELIGFVKSRLAGFPECNRFIAWLEKQDTFSKKDVDDAYLKGITDAKNEIEKQYEIIFPKLKESEDKKIRKVIYNAIKYLETEHSWDFLDDVDILDVYAWLEKEDEKPQGKSALEAIKEEKVDNQNCVKPTDKVEPKFKVGDWVVDNYNYVWKIEEILNQFYLLEDVEGGEACPTINWVDKTFRLWNIQDAKNGDVLSANWREGANFWERIIIFNKYHSKGIKGVINAPYVEGYGNTFKNGKLIPCAKVPYYSTWTDNLYPATKEQRDLLFQKLKEAGYEWDADNKELKKEEIK